VHYTSSQSFAAGDALGFLGLADNLAGLDLVLRNLQPLRAAGLYEQALVCAYVKTRTNWRRFPHDVIKSLFRAADRDRLRACGEPLPGAGPFTVYRGVCGRGRARRVRGISWTGSLAVAAWFANRFAERDLPDAAVYRADVDAAAVLAFLHDDAGRGEDEYLVLLPDSCRVRRVTCDISALAMRHAAEIQRSNETVMQWAK
jgi:hypothetical protein